MHDLLCINLGIFSCCKCWPAPGEFQVPWGVKKRPHKAAKAAATKSAWGRRVKEGYSLAHITFSRIDVDFPTPYISTASTTADRMGTNAILCIKFDVISIKYITLAPWSWLFCFKWLFYKSNRYLHFLSKIHSLHNKICGKILWQFICIGNVFT